MNSVLRGPVRQGLIRLLIIARVEKLILADKRITVDDIAAEVGISHGTAHNIYRSKCC